MWCALAKLLGISTGFALVLISVVCEQPNQMKDVEETFSSDEEVRQFRMELIKMRILEELGMSEIPKLPENLTLPKDILSKEIFRMNDMSEHYDHSYEAESRDIVIFPSKEVAARGQDVDDIKYVINFDFPNCSEDYVHRIGRTGRSNKSGTAYTFFTENNIKQAGDLIAVLNEANQAINPKLMEMAEMPRSFGSSKGRNSGKWKQSMTRFNRNGYKPNDSMRNRSSGPRELSENRGSNIRFNNTALNAGGNFYNRSINSQPLSQSNIPNNPVNRQTSVQSGFGQFGSGVNNSWFSNRP